MTEEMKLVAAVFKDAKDAPTSFEPEEWLDGFEDARYIIGYRIAECMGRGGKTWLKKAGIK